MHSYEMYGCLSLYEIQTFCLGSPLSSRLLLNPIILDCQSNPNPSQICDLQSKSKFQFSKWIDNPIQI